MPVVFERAYVVEELPSGGARIAVGLRSTSKLGISGEVRQVWEYLVNSSYWEALSFEGRLSEEKDGVLTFDAVGDSQFVFTPLTLELFDGMKDSILSYDAVRAQVTTNDEIQDFYVAGLMFDAWGETPVVESVDVLLAIVEGRKPFPVGTVRHWNDGFDYRKEPDGAWLKLRADTSAAHTVRDEHGWTERAAGLPDNTLKAFFKNGKPVPERRALHKKIEREIFGKAPSAPEGVKPVAVLTMGTPASGKSVMVSERLEGEDHVRIDPDAVKQRIPEYQRAVEMQARNAADLVHDESAWLAEQFLHKAVRGKQSFVFEGVGRDPVYYSELVQNLQRQGYHVSVLMPHLSSLDEALSRAERRGRREGRFVRNDRIAQAHKVLPKNFRLIARMANEAFLASSDTYPPTPLWEKKSDGSEVVHDEQRYNEFVAAAKLPTDESVALEPIPPPSELHLDTAVLRKLYLEGLRREQDQLQRPEPEGANNMAAVRWPLEDVGDALHRLRLQVGVELPAWEQSA